MVRQLLGTVNAVGAGFSSLPSASNVFGLVDPVFDTAVSVLEFCD